MYATSVDLFLFLPRTLLRARPPPRIFLLFIRSTDVFDPWSNERHRCRDIVDSCESLRTCETLRALYGVSRVVRINVADLDGKLLVKSENSLL